MVLGINVINLAYLERTEIAPEKGYLIEADGPEVIIQTILQPVFFKNAVFIVQDGKVVLAGALFKKI